MNILIIDGQGGKLGKQLVNSILKRYPEHNVTVAGTNAVATSSMLKCTQLRGATGENAVIVGARKADVIIGPVGIVIADALLGEISPAMAVAVGQSAAVKILLPVNRCDNLVAGITDQSINVIIEDALDKIGKIDNA